MQQSRLLFITIIVLAVLAVIGMLMVRQFLPGEPLELPAMRESVTIQIAAAPSIKPWVEQAARTFNQQNAQVQVQIVEADGLAPVGQFTANPDANSPAAWLAEASFIVDLAHEEGLQDFSDVVPVAETSMAWGAYADKLAAFDGAGGDLTWQEVQARAVDPADRLNLVIASPHNSAEGLAVLISAVAANVNKTGLSASDVSQADGWLTGIFAENTRVRATPAEDFATQGRSLGDAGALTTAAWRGAGLPGRDDFTNMPLAPAVTLNYPLAIWTAAPQEAQAAAKEFRTFLLSEAQQNNLADFHFDRPNTAQPGVQADGSAVQALLRWADRVLR